MRPFIPFPLTAALCAVLASQFVAAAELGSLKLEDSVQLAGRDLKLNGTGISMRMVFKVYAISLYLVERTRNAEAVLGADGPRRVLISMLRDVSSREFSCAMLESLQADRAFADDPRIAERLRQLGQRITARPGGLRKGDSLTLDWIPGTGAVIALNQQLLVEPIGDKALYDALLNIWIGAKPADPSLKTKLLGLTP